MIQVGRCWSWLLAGLVLGGCVTPSQSGPPPMPSVSPTPQPQLHYRTYLLSQGTTAHVLRIPLSRFRVVPAMAEAVEPLPEFARQAGAIAVLNGGYFDPQNQQSTSYIVVQGQLVGDPQQNQQLVQNPRLAPYLEQIWNRSELRRYQCGSQVQYGFATQQQAVPTGCQRVDALGAGPRLLPELTAESEAFLDSRQGQVVRDPVGVNAPNARTAIGLTRQGEMIWVMVAQNPANPNTSGMTLPELARWMRSLGVEEALNLDGGSSSSLYYQGQTWYGKVNEAGERVQRRVKSVLVLQEIDPNRGPEASGRGN